MKCCFAKVFGDLRKALQPSLGNRISFYGGGAEHKIEISFQHFFTTATRKAGSCFFYCVALPQELQFHNHFITFASFWPIGVAVTLRLKRRLCIIASSQHLKQTHL